MSKTPKSVKSKKETKSEAKPVSDNRRARHEYEILEVFEVGVALVGTEVKSIRQGKANLQDSFARIEENEVWLYRVIFHLTILVIVLTMIQFANGVY